MPPRLFSLILTLICFAACQGLRAEFPPSDLANEQLADLESSQGFVQAFCVDCHGIDQPESGVSFALLSEMSAEEQKDKWHQVLRQLRSGEMPPSDAAQPSEQNRTRVQKWIVENFGPANDPSDPNHWSLIPATRPEIPRIADGSDINHPIDAFIIRRLDEAGLSLSPLADRRTLLRRVTLDLTGLLPTRDELNSFVNADDFQIAFEKVVDRLLESPHYGERWAQHWLDVIRWAETVGFETNAERRDAWHYRDWVIDALNRDQPYDRFITDQLMGDQTGADAALGFLVAGPANLPGQVGRDEEAMRQARQDELDEVIRTVSQSLFGLTIGCARCHDHKFDPISQRDYYALQATFAGLRYGTRRLRGLNNDAWMEKLPTVQLELDRLRQQRNDLQRHHGLREAIKNVQTGSFPQVQANSVRMEIRSTTRGAASLYEFQIGAVTPKAVPPKAVTPKAVTPKAVTPKAVTPKAVTPKASKPSTPESRNVALASSGGIASASSFALANQTRHFENLIDGSVDRRQAFPWVAAKTGPAWIQIDLAEPTIIDRVTWHDGSSVPTDYTIQVRNAKTGQWTEVAHTRDRTPRLDDTRPASKIQIAGMTKNEIASLMQLLSRIRARENEVRRLSAGPQTYAASFESSPTRMMRLHRGDPMQPREEAIASPPAVLASVTLNKNPETEVMRRKQLVQHLTRADHPLTARVIVNRIWQHHFGIGLVETSSDFGRMGRPPTHPELLDWLAVEFVEKGWRMKSLHRQIVLSRTYTQQSRSIPDSIKSDSQARLLWRFPPRRLDAEAIRDCVLQSSGKLNPSMHGQGFNFFRQRGGLADYKPIESFNADGSRRMIYAHKIRMQSVDVFGAFDCPDAGQMTPRRSQSITPIQSLGLLNSPFMIRQSENFAKRLNEATQGDLVSAVRLGFEIAFSRHPTPTEQAQLLSLARHHGLNQACRVILNTSEFVSLQ